MAGLQAEQLLRELSDLWVKLGKEERGGQGVLRACTMTLIVLVEEEDAMPVSETLAQVTPAHPSRTILIQLKDKADVSGRVNAQCWMPFGSRQQICSEQIEITSSPGRLKEVAAVVLGLIAPDLPVVMWSRCGRALPSDDFSVLLPHVDKLIVDSDRLKDPKEFLKAGVRMTHPVVADLAWTRLTRWRQCLANAFESPHLSARIPEIQEVEVQYSGETPSTSALYLAGWLKACLKDRPRVLLSRTGGGEQGVQAVTLRGKEPLATIRTAGGEGVEMQCGTLTSHMAFPKLDDQTLLREELNIVGRDRAYDSALTRAVEMSSL